MSACTRLPWLAAASLLLTGCVTTMGTGGTEPPPEAPRPGAVCAVWLPISWSASDTDQTIREVKANNRARAGWGCPPS
jgi:hypothetical protein